MRNFYSNDHSDAVTAFDVFGRIHAITRRKYANTEIQRRSIGHADAPRRFLKNDDDDDDEDVEVVVRPREMTKTGIGKWKRTSGSRSRSPWILRKWHFTPSPEAGIHKTHISRLFEVRWWIYLYGNDRGEKKKFQFFESKNFKKSGFFVKIWDLNVSAWGGALEEKWSILTNICRSVTPEVDLRFHFPIWVLDSARRTERS